MTGWDWFGIFSAFILVLVVACWATYTITEVNSFSIGYETGREAERMTVHHQLNRVLYQALKQGLTSLAVIDRLYAQAVRRIDADGAWPGRGDRP